MAKYKSYTIVTPKGHKLVLKARKLKKKSVRWVPDQMGFRPICEHIVPRG